MGYTSDQTDEPSVQLVLIIDRILFEFSSLFFCFHSYQVHHHLHQLALVVVEYLHQVKFFLDVNYYHIHHHLDMLNDYHFHKLNKEKFI